MTPLRTLQTEKVNCTFYIFSLCLIVGLHHTSHKQAMLMECSR